MNDHLSFQRFAAWAAMFSAPLAYASVIVLLIAVDYNFDAFSDLRILLVTGAVGSGFLRWSMWLDMFGYYLLITPLTLVLWRWLKPRDPDRVGLYTLCILAYILIGAIGAAILAAAVPPLIISYAEDPGHGPIIEVVYFALMNSVYGGLWNVLEEFIAGIGWIGIGSFLRQEHNVIGIITMILGTSCIADSIGVILGLESIASIALNIYLFLAPLWALILGIELLRKPAQIGTA
jgi:hypothetical protein